MPEASCDCIKNLLSKYSDADASFDQFGFTFSSFRPLKKDGSKPERASHERFNWSFCPFCGKPITLKPYSWEKKEGEQCLKPQQP